ncbi:MAG: T9SS type A sorting domain-containing protein [Bacteroidales bacterium]|jgi:hypothetical protein|nr:T9SS type A sorting domain-containing protein [Bacteroidales bacterium]
MKKFTLLILAVLFTSSVFALNTKTWVGAGTIGGNSSYDFNAAANWSPSGIPSSADSCVLNLNKGDSPSILITSNITIGALYITLTSVTGPSYGELVVGTYTLTINGTTHGEVISADGSQLQFGVGDSPGTLIYNGDADFIAPDPSLVFAIAGDVTGGYYLTSSTGQVIFRGNATFNNGTTGSYYDVLPATVIFDAPGNQTISANNTGDFSVYLGGVTTQIGSTNNPTVVVAGIGGTTSLFKVIGDLNINGTSTLDLQNNSMNRNSAGGTLSLSSSATLKLAGANNYPTNFTTNTLSGTTNYYASGIQTVPVLTYNDLIFSGSGAKTTGTGAIAVDGNFDVTGASADLNTNNTSISVAGNITGTGAISSGSGTISVGGSWTNNGTFTADLGTVSYNGTSAQNIVVFAYKNLTLAGSGTKTFAGTTTISGKLSINESAVANLGTGLTHTSNMLTLGGAGQASGSWGSTASSATNKNNTYFLSTSNGIVNVTTGSNTQWTGTTNTDWNTASNWLGGTVPVATSDVVIPSGGNQPTIGAAGALCSNLTINNGAILTIGGAYNLTISGNFTNNGTFAPGTGTITYNGTSAQNILNVTYQNLTVNNSGGVSLIDNTVVNGTLTLTAGSLNLGSNSLTINGNTSVTSGTLYGTTSSNLIINGTGALSGALTFASGGQYLNSLTLNRTSSGSATLNSNLTFGPGTSTLTNGNLVVNSSCTLTLTGTLNCTSTNAVTGSGTFNNLSGSTLGIGSPDGLAFGAGNIRTNNKTWGYAANYTYNGTSAQVTGTSLPPQLQGTFMISNSSGVTLSTDLEISGDNGILSLSTGTLTVGPYTLKISSNSPTRTTGNIDASNASATASFNNSSTITLPASIFTGNVNNLTLNGSGGVTLGSSMTVANALTLTNGTLNIGTNTLTLNSSTTKTSGTLTSSATGTVNYNQNIAGQAVLSGTYGNLILSDYDKTLSSSGLINISGTFTPGSASGHSLTGSTIVYNGSSPQTLPLGFTTYNNLTLNNASGTNGFTGLIVNGTIRVQAGTFASASTYNNVQIDDGATLTAADDITVNGNWTNNGSFTPVTYKVTFGGSAQQTINGSTTTTFNNLELNNTNGLVLNTSAHVVGTFSLLNGSLSINGNTLSYGASGILKYGGSITQTTSDEWPVTDGPNDLIVDGTDVRLDLNRTLAGGLTINTGKKFTVNAGKAFTVNGTLTNSAGNSGLVIKSDGLGTGSLIHSTADVNATVERYIAGWSDINHGWHLIASPVSSQNISPNFTDLTPANYDFFKWDETVSDLPWINYKSGGFTTFTVGQGYLCGYNATATKNFAGTLNNASTSTITLSRTDAGNFSGWNLLGNPFPSAIQWNKTNTSWNLTNVTATAKIWNETNASYRDIAKDSIIPAMQGFMVEVPSGAAGSLVIPAVDKVHNVQAWYKSTGDPAITLVAHDTKGNTAQESIIRFNPGATSSFDPAFDSHFLAGYAPQYYSVSNNENLSTNCLPEVNGALQIPFDFIKNDGNNFTIEAKTISDIQGPVILNDLKTGATQDLTVNPIYSFISSPGDNPSRFLITFSHVGIGEAVTKNAFSVRASGNTILVINNTGNNQGSVFVYNMMGQLMMTQVLNGSQMTTISLNAGTGYYLVKAVTNDQTYSAKVFLQ